jgi:hypothetical protein
VDEGAYCAAAGDRGKNWYQQRAKIMQITGKFICAYEYKIHHIL